MKINKYKLLILIFFLIIIFFGIKNYRLSADTLKNPFSATPTPTIETQKKVTLIEGQRIEEMAERIDVQLSPGQGKEFLKIAKEGYMFPDTYFVDRIASASAVGVKMKDNFENKYDASLQAKIKKLGLTPNEGVILASIVEREARSPEARKMVASILLKRLNIEMGLNVDAGIQYALGYQPQEKSWWKRHLTKADLKVDSPFNTYIHRGLPPAPICNPSLSAFEAVASADPKTPYLYYYHDSEGIPRYAKTLEEHNQNIANYL